MAKVVADKRHAAAYADAVVAAQSAGDGAAAAAAMAKLELVCRRAGVDPKILLAEADRRARLADS
jgi:hypothetical protein